MKKTLKLVSLVLALALCAGLFAACGTTTRPGFDPGVSYAAAPPLVTSSMTTGYYGPLTKELQPVTSADLPQDVEPDADKANHFSHRLQSLMNGVSPDQETLREAVDTAIKGSVKDMFAAVVYSSYTGETVPNGYSNYYDYKGELTDYALGQYQRVREGIYAQNFTWTLEALTKADHKNVNNTYVKNGEVSSVKNIKNDDNHRYWVVARANTDIITADNKQIPAGTVMVRILVYCGNTVGKVTITGGGKGGGGVCVNPIPDPAPPSGGGENNSSPDPTPIPTTGTEYRDVVVYYKDINTREEIRGSEWARLEYGAYYNVSGWDKVAIDGYEYYETSGYATTGTLWQNIEITVWYVKYDPISKYTVTVRYKDVQTLQEIIDPNWARYIKGATYDVRSWDRIAIDNYRYNTTSGHATYGTIWQDLEITVWYDKVQAVDRTVTVVFKHVDDGAAVANPYAINVKDGTWFDVTGSMNPNVDVKYTRTGKIDVSGTVYSSTTKGNGYAYSNVTITVWYSLVEWQQLPAGRYPDPGGSGEVVDVPAGGGAPRDEIGTDVPQNTQPPAEKPQPILPGTGGVTGTDESPI